MCTGIEIAALASSAASVGGSIMGGKESKKAGKETGEAVFADALAHARIIRKQARQVRSGAQASYAASGIDVSQGTPLVVDQYIVGESELDALNAILGGERQRRVAKAGGNAQATGQYLQGASTALSSFGQLSGFAGK